MLGGGGDPFLSDADTLTEPYGVNLTGRLHMARIAHLRIKVLVDALLGPYDPPTLGLEKFGENIGENEMEPED